MGRPLSKRARILRMALHTIAFLVNVPIVIYLVYVWNVSIFSHAMVTTLMIAGIDALFFTLLVFIFKLNECIELKYKKSVIGFIVAITLLVLIIATIGVVWWRLSDRATRAITYVPKIPRHIPVETVSAK